MSVQVVKMRAGNYRVPVNLEKRGKRFFLGFGYNPTLKDHVKALEGARWHGYESEENPNPEKLWSIEDTQHNKFQMDFLLHNPNDPTTPADPYRPYNGKLEPLESRKGRPLYKHQKEMFSHVVCRRHCILACEMGTGKTLVAIEAIEYAVEVMGVDPHDIVYCAPKNALESVRADFKEWKCPYRPHFLTYEALVQKVEQWQDGQSAPRVVIFDESSRLKNPTSQRARAAKYVADCMREEYGRECMIVLMSGSPAPKSPVDWYHQCEVACPGFLKEGTYNKAKARLALIVNDQNEIGQQFPRLVTWFDDAKKCKICGCFDKLDLKGKPYLGHDPSANLFGDGKFHEFVASVNEVETLYKRMMGLVLVKFKRDCLDLPAKTFRRIKVKPKQSTLNAAKILAKRAKTTMQGLILLRELSDGFQYKDTPNGTEPCPSCRGTGNMIEYYHTMPDGQIVQGDWNIALMDIDSPVATKPPESREVTCYTCKGEKVVPHFERETKPVPCPKLDVVKEMLESHEDVGRLVIYGGFTATVDRIVDTCKDMGWEVLRIDGRGWGWFGNPEGIPAPADTAAKYLAFRKEFAEHPRVVAVCQADSAGMGLNFSASPTIVLYSVGFNGESYVQAIERTHRLGIEKTLERMANIKAVKGDKALDAKIEIVQIIHLPSDEYVYDNLDKKLRLQDQTLGSLQAAMDRAVVTEDRET